MLIPLHQSRRKGAEKRAPQPANERIARSNLIRVEQRLVKLKRIAVSCTRLIVIMFGVLAFRWTILMPIHPRALALAITLGCLGLALGYTQHYAGWPMLALDSVAILLLLFGTGGAGSPLLALTLVPMLLGGLLGNSNGVLAGTCTGVTIFLIVNLTQRTAPRAIVFDLVLLQVCCGLTVSWLWRGFDGLLATLLDDLCVPHEATHAPESPRSPIRTVELDRQIAECLTLDQLARLTIDRAVAIAGVAAQADLTGRPAADESEGADPGRLRVVVRSEDISGTITIHSAPCELSLAQRDAIEHLACLVGQRAAVLRQAASQQRQRAAIAALWEISGLLRIASTGEECARHGLMRLAEALDLGWLALLAPNQFNALAPFLIARGRGRAGVPTISGPQLRVAAEALRGERPLIRMEGAHALICLPICLAGHAPMVVAAYDTIDDASTQALLMLFGNLIVDRLARGYGLEVRG